MESGYEKRLLALYIDRLVRGLGRRSIALRQVIDWLQDNEAILEIDLSAFESGNQPKKSKAKHRKLRRSSSRLSVEAWRQLTRALAARVKGFRNHAPDRFERNLVALSDSLGLSETECGILRIAARYVQSNAFDDLLDRMIGTRVLDSPALMALLLDVPESEIRRLLAESNLIARGLISPWNINSPDYFQFGMPYALRKALLPPNDGLADIEQALIGKPLPAELAWEDYDHLAEPRAFLAALLQGAARRPEKGINILIYGPPGTGKTEFCKTLATQGGHSLHAVGEADQKGGEPNRAERLAALQLGQQIAGRRPGHLLLFDEMEDVLALGMRVTTREGSYNRSGSKVFLNRLLQENETPTLWTCNWIENFDPALLRRFSFTLEMKLPPAGVRERIWQRLLEKEKLAVPQAEAGRMARRFAIAPGIAAGALRSTALAGGKADQLSLAVEALGKAVQQGRLAPPQGQETARFNLALTQADCDLAALCRRLARPEAPRDLSLCLYGPPGTGKSAFLRHLAGEMGMDVLHKRASDLLSKWLGESERNIADAFAEARANRQFLIFDEADSLLYERSGSSRSFEVAQVNEMLTWMEVHDLPFACTTNLMVSLDRAALRRFAFKVKFDYLSPAQSAAAFQLFFGLEAPPVLHGLQLLTPGDFAVVARKLRFLEAAADPQEIAALLEQECRLKPGQTQSIGFRAAPKENLVQLVRPASRD